MTAILYIVGTPIGNLKDISERALETLRNSDLIAAEDTRVTLKLLNRYEIKKPMISYHKHNMKSVGEKIIESLNEGLTVSLVSDAGLPAISDPGEELVKLAIENNFEVVSIPGPSASLTALQLSALSTDKFIFEGFLTQKRNERKKELERISRNPYTTILYESPHRILDLLEDINEIMPERKISVSRELTKKFEETFRGTAEEAFAYFEQNAKGEFAVCIEGYTEEKSEYSDDEIKKLLAEFVSSGLSKKDAVKKTAETLGLPKNRIYQISTETED